MHRILAAIAVAVLLTAGLAAALAASNFEEAEYEDVWPTTCVALNDIVEAHLGNDGYVGMYERAFGDEAEDACRVHNRELVQQAFAWAFERSPDDLALRTDIQWDIERLWPTRWRITYWFTVANMNPVVGHELSFGVNFLDAEGVVIAITGADYLLIPAGSQRVYSNSQLMSADLLRQAVSLQVVRLGPPPNEN